MIDYDRCPCGFPDCPDCHPELQVKMTCEACGSDVRKWQMHDDIICENCHEEGFGVCKCCDEIEILADGELCSKCWIAGIREGLEAC